jgi:hypothetical protein
LQVDSLISQVADEHGLEIAGKVGAGSVPAGKPGAKEKEHDELEERLNRLKAV